MILIPTEISFLPPSKVASSLSPYPCYPISGWGVSRVCPQTWYLGFLYPVSIGTKDSEKVQPNTSSLALPQGYCLQTPPPEALALGIILLFPLQLVSLFLAPFLQNLPPPHTTHSLMAQGSTFHTLSWGRGQWSCGSCSRMQVVFVCVCVKGRSCLPDWPGTGGGGCPKGPQF